MELTAFGTCSAALVDTGLSSALCTLWEKPITMQKLTHFTFNKEFSCRSERDQHKPPQAFIGLGKRQRGATFVSFFGRMTGSF